MAVTIAVQSIEVLVNSEKKCDVTFGENSLETDCDKIEITSVKIEQQIEVIDLKVLFDNFCNLEAIVIQKCQQISFTEYFLANSSVKRFVANKNCCQKIHPYGFSESKYLEELDLAGNSLTVIRKTTFQRSMKLKFINLSRNKITNVEPETFDCPALESVNLHGNKIKSINGLLFTSKLSSLNLSSNEIERIDGDSFGQLEYLEILDLSHNKINGVASTAFKRLSEFQLDLRDNPCYKGSEIIPKFNEKAIKECIRSYENTNQVDNQYKVIRTAAPKDHGSDDSCVVVNSKNRSKMIVIFIKFTMGALLATILILMGIMLVRRIQLARNQKSELPMVTVLRRNRFKHARPNNSNVHENAGKHNARPLKSSQDKKLVYANLDFAHNAGSNPTTVKNYQKTSYVTIQKP